MRVTQTSEASSENVTQSVQMGSGLARLKGIIESVESTRRLPSCNDIELVAGLVESKASQQHWLTFHSNWGLFASGVDEYSSSVATLLNWQKIRIELASEFETGPLEKDPTHVGWFLIWNRRQKPNLAEHKSIRTLPLLKPPR